MDRRQDRKTREELDTIRQFSRQYNYSIRGTETDTRDKLQPCALMSMIQEAASIDAEYHQCGAKELDPEGFCWLLLRTSVRMSAIPGWKDQITIDTWTNGVERLLSIRDFFITDPAGRFFGKATTTWLVVDKETHRPRKITVLNNPRIMEKSVSALGFNSPKLEESFAELPELPILSEYAGYSDIDRNNHVNNTRYVAWCMDAVGMCKIPDADLIGIDINYISEVKPGETVDLYLAALPVERGFCPEAKAARLVVGKHGGDRKTAFLAALYWDSPL